jgi:hypothetical protein
VRRRIRALAIRALPARRVVLLGLGFRPPWTREAEARLGSSSLCRDGLVDDL